MYGRHWFTFCFTVICLLEGTQTQRRVRPLKGKEPDIKPIRGLPSVGGTPVPENPNRNRNKVGWTVYIHRTGTSMTEGNRVHCGGSIIDNKHVLTAAHCVTFYLGSVIKQSSLTIHTGRIDLFAYESEREQIRTVTSRNIIVHPKYDPLNLNNDIAILTLDVPVLFDERTFAVNLPKQDASNINNLLCRVTGWGKTENASFSNDLLEIRIKKRNCKLPATLRKKVDSTTMFCAHKKGRDACSGDSGGPYVCWFKKVEGQDGEILKRQWVQYGIVSGS